ncbi:hypothetical protein [Brevibacterium sediminis]|uniref:Asp23/Gls24 family envelope stress response protein n=1 Tax=Brevibacterium sediminis TaxID=1857024 RepID=A0A5C4X0I8_9MICO|nr:hypothetical protein [Brevibacterium sediminis]TNM54063.1 hypothetical protein FHQ09_12385 [Brevibacterium sediminis]GGC37959.1 hypothetical protein GCM10010974_20470 [Brevibacterium sediminis]
MTEKPRVQKARVEKPRFESGTSRGFDEAAVSARLTESVTGVDGVTGLAPGLRDMIANAAARVMRRTGSEPLRVEVWRTGEDLGVRIDAHLDDSRPVTEIVDELFAVIAVDLQAAVDGPIGEIDIDVHIVSRSR